MPTNSWYYLDSRVAFGPTPTDLRAVASEFDVVIPVAVEGELGHDPRVLREYGVEVYPFLVPDLRAPPLLDLAAILGVALAASTGRGAKVLIYGGSGRGRTGTIAAAYLVERYGFSAEEAMRRVRKLNPDAIETREQWSVVKAYEAFIGSLTRKALSLIEGIGVQYAWGKGKMHVSRVTQLALRLWAGLHRNLELGYPSQAYLSAGALLHDIGYAFTSSKEEAGRRGYEFLRRSDELEAALGPHGRDIVAHIVKLHHLGVRGIEGNDTSVDAASRIAALTRAAAALDYSKHRAVWDVEAEARSGEVVVKLYCPMGCEEDRRQLEEVNKDLLEKVLGAKLTTIVVEESRAPLS